MELLERYLQAVGRYLPEARRADILAELDGNLREAMEDRAEAQGRPLREDEQAEVLRRYGHPVAVAARYGSAPPLIGAEIAPFYWFTLRRATPFVVALVACTRVVVWFDLPGVSHGLLPQVGAVVKGVFWFWAVTTMVFAQVEWMRRRVPQAFTQPWDPRRLPPVRKERREGLPAHPVFDLLFNLFFLLWLLLFPGFPVLFLGPAARMMQGLALHLAPVWHTAYWLVVATTCVQIVFKAVAFREVSLEFRRGLKVAEGMLSLGLLLFLLRAPSYLVRSPGPTSATDLRLLAIGNEGVHQVLVLITAVMAIKLAWELVRLFSGRVRGAPVRAAPISR